jgi:hypothetical protein
MVKIELDSWAKRWAREVKTAEEIPDAFLEFYNSITLEGYSPYTVFTPPDRWGFNRTSPKIISMFEDKIAIAEKVKKDIIKKVYYFKDINFIEWRTVLLSSWLKINGTVNDVFSSTTIEFNTVKDYLFKPILKKIRASINGLRTENKNELLEKEKNKFNYLNKINFKYMNFARESLMPAESVINMVLQPYIRIKFMKYFYKIISSPHFTILTDKELIIIKDDNTLLSEKGITYGGIWNYIPINKIDSISLTENQDLDTLNFTLSLKGNAVLNSLFSPQQKQDIVYLINEAEKLKSHVFQ